MVLKILFLTDKFYPYIGGIETMSEILASAFVDAGHEVHLLTHTPDTNESHFPFLIIRKPSFFKILKEHLWADIIFENNPCLQLSLHGIFFGKPSIIALQTWLYRSNGKIGWQDRFKFLWLKRAKKVISCSNIIRERCSPSSTVISNPYRENVFKVIPEIPKTYKFLFVGRLVSDKGADLAIKAFNQIFLKNQPNGNSDLSLTIVGDGPERKSIENLILDLGLTKHIILKGSLSGRQLVECINQHEIILVPSMWEEPFGIVALEGMACGCLPIVSNGGGLPDAIGDAGLLFERGNLNSLVLCMEQLINDQSLQEQLRVAAITHLKSHTSSFISKRYLDVIESVFNIN
jgi:glycosyltransferase involved in cell wall biosynthesis